MTSILPRAAQVSAFHDAALLDRRHEPPVPGPLWESIARNHRFNCQLWDEEDLARRRDVPDAAIAANKRAIDGFNQQRNDATESVDELVLAVLSGVERAPGCRLNSETAGSMIDRLSILSLKIHHMRIQTQRTDAGAAHVERCRTKLTLLREQREDLQSCFDALIDECRAGRMYYKIYRQFKMYNDPALNPHLYGAGAHRGSAETGNS